MSNFDEDERQLIRGLEALSNVDEGAPPAVKARLRAAFRQSVYRQPARWLPTRWLKVAAAVLALAVLIPLPNRHPKKTASPDLASFIPLDSEPVSAGIVVRVKLPRAMFFDEGGPGVVEADVLLGDDGLAHAVRFIE
jgi:hypothetical protein